MSTSNTPAVPGAVVPHFEAAYLRLMPTVLRVARRHFRNVGCPDRRSELVCEVLALCWLWHGRLASKGRDPAEFACVFALTAAKAVNSGRRLCGQEKARDALSARCQRRRGFTVAPLPDGSAMFGNDFDEALRDNMQTPIPDQVQFRIDFPRWADGLPAQKRKVLERLVRGERTQDVADAVGLTPARVSQLRREFHDDYAAFCEGTAT